MTSVEQWLEQLGLGRYADAFVESDVDLEVLPHLTEGDLESLGVSLGHRKRILAAIGAPGSPGAARAQRRPVADGAGGAAAGAHAERRQLTVMFCDLVGSTALSARLDPEDLRELIRAYQVACTHAILRYEGFVARYMGDGIMAYFGYPRAHEDDAERAVHAGLAVLGALSELDSKVVRGNGLSPAVRIGIATGLVVAGDLIGEGASEERAVVGETPNLAARLQGVASPNELVVSEATRRLAGERFEYADRGVHALKGIDAPARAWQVVRARPDADRFELAARAGLAPLVGREEEVTLLLRRWRQAAEGDAQAVVLTGEAGVGKSRVLKVVQDRLGGELRNRVLYYGSAYHEQSAFRPVIEQIGRAMRFTSEDGPQEKLDKLEATLRELDLDVAEHAPVVASLLSIPGGERFPVPELGPEALKQRTLHALVAMVEAMTVRDPVLLVLEDAHWVDASTLELVGRVVEQLRRARLLCVVTARPEYEPPWQGEPHTTLLTLTRLTRAEAAELVRHVAGGKALPEEVVDRIVDHTDGVPIFVEELTKAVLESGLLREGESGWEIAEPGRAVEIPATLQDSLMARLDRLGPTKELAQLASVFGREFAFDWLRAVAREDEDMLRDSLDRLVRAGLVYRQSVVPRETYAFKHALVQEAAYAALLGSRRRAYHGRIATVLVERFPDVADSAPEALARHFAESETPEKSIPHWHRAARRAMERLATPAAYEHLRRGLDLLERLTDVDERSRLELELRLAEAEVLRMAARLAEAMTASRRAAELAVGLGDAKALADAAVAHEFSEFWSGVPEEESIGLLETALGRLGEAVSGERARLLGSLARAFGSTGQPERAAELVEEAIAMARRLSDPKALFDVLNQKTYLWRLPREIPERMATLDEMVRIARELGDGEREQRAYSWRAFDRLEVGDTESFRADLETYERLSSEMRQPVHMWLARSCRSVEAMIEGRFADAERLSREAASFADRVQGWDPGGQLGVQMFTIRREQGRLGEIAPVLEHVLSRAGRARSWQPGLAVLYAELDRRRDAERTFEALAESDFVLPFDATWCASIVYLAEVCAYLGDRDRAAILYERLLPYSGYVAGMGVAVVCYGAADRFLGQLATTTENWEAAERHFEQGLALNEAMGARPWLAHTRHRYAEMLLVRGRDGDRERAESLLGEALATADALGMEALRSRIRSLGSAVTAARGC